MPWHLTWQLGGTQPFCTHFHVPKPSINWTQFLIGLPSRDLHLSSCKPQVRDLKTHSCETGMLWAKIPGFLTRVRPPNVNMVGTMFISVFMMTRNLQQMIYDNTCCGKAFFFFFKSMLAYHCLPSSMNSPLVLIYCCREVAAAGLIPGKLGQGLWMPQSIQSTAFQPASDTACPTNISLPHSVHYLWMLSTILISLRTLNMKTMSRICWLLYCVAEKRKFFWKMSR